MKTGLLAGSGEKTSPDQRWEEKETDQRREKTTHESVAVVGPQWQISRMGPAAELAGTRTNIILHGH